MRKPSVMEVLRASAVFQLFILIFSCSSSSPEIISVFRQLDVLRSPEDGSQSERLIVYAQVEDEDGSEDIELWKVKMPELGLEWRRNSKQWREVVRDEQRWIGSSGLSLPFEEPFPRGEYVIEVQDRAGESATESFILSESIEGCSEGPVDPENFPRLDFSRKGARVVSPSARHTFSFSDKGRQVVETKESEQRMFDEEELDKLYSRGVRYITIGLYRPSMGVALKSGPYALPAP